MSADQGQDIRDMAALQAKVAGLSAALVMLESRVDAMESKGANATPSPEAVDPGMPEADLLAMRERLRVRTLEGIKANKTDPTRAGRTFRRDIS